MAERLNNTIETQMNDGNTIVSQIVDNNQPLQTVIQDVPQVQTVLQNDINVSSQINAPFVEVTSVNGKTGDVITEPVVGEFEPNHYYLKNTMIGYNNNLYYAKETFTSGSSFNANDWYSVEGSQITVDSALSTTSENPVQNKVITNALNNKNKTIYTAYNVAPAEDTTAEWRTLLGGQGVYITWYNTTRTFTNQPVQYGFMRTIIGANDIRQDFWQQTSGVHYVRTGNASGWSSYAGTTGVFKNLGAQPGNGTLTIQRNGANIQTFTANQSGNATANILVPTKTSEIENDSDFLVMEDLFTTKSGKNISISDAAAVPLVSFQLDGETSQNGTPTPSAPVPVKVVTGENVIKINGKNLLKLTQQASTSNGITATLNDGVISYSGTASSNWANITARTYNYIQAGAYTLSMKETFGSNYAFALAVTYTDNTTATFETWQSVGNKRTVTFTKDVASYYVYLTGLASGTSYSGTISLMLELGSTATTPFEPYQEQSYEVNLGKNLFNKDANQYLYGYFDNSSLQIVSASSTGRNAVVYLPCEPSTTYTINAQSLATGNIRAISTTEVLPTNGVAVPREIASGFDAATFTTPSSAHYIVIRYRTISAEETIADNIQTFMASLQVEKGSQATSYASYFAPIELCKIGTYQDYIYKSGGKWYVHKECGVAHLPGDLSAVGISDTNTAGVKRFGIGITGSSNVLRALTGKYPILCSILQPGDRGDTYAKRETIGYGIDGTGVYRDFSVYIAACNAMTTSQFQSWVNSNPFDIVYILATPTDTEITNATLVGQLETILSAGQTYAGTTNITTVIATGNEQGTLEITYPKFFSKIATTSSLGLVRVGDGLNITPEGTLSTQLDFTTESTSGNTKIIRLQDGTTTSYPITTKEAVLGLGDDKFDASFLYDCTLDSTAFTQEQAEALKDAILADKEILIYEVNTSTNKGLYRPHYVSASEDSALKTINVQYINQAPAQVLFSFMSINGADWTLTVRTTPL